MTVIENSDRGITLNKTLAWTVLVGLLGAGVLVGTQTATLTSGIVALQGDLDAAIQTQATEVGKRERLADRITDRVRALEIRGSARDTAFSNLSTKMQEVTRQLQENNRLLRELLRQAKQPTN